MVPKMHALLVFPFLAFAEFAFAQLEGRGFPDCQNGPLKNNAVCDQSAGKYI